jgi:outer membrane protein
MPPKATQFIALPVCVFLQITSVQAASPIQFDGDLGAATYITQGQIRGQETNHLFLPYAYFDYGRFYARVDTLGFKVLPLAYGNLEIAGRISLEGYKSGDTSLHGIQDRGSPVPLGIGSFQETPIGAFFVYAFHDFESSGSLLEATYVTEFHVGGWSFYPQVGIERRSAKYVGHLYGVSASEAVDSGLPAYMPGAATNPVLGLAGEIPLNGSWGLDWQWQHKWLGDSIKNSPLVSAHAQNLGYVALAYHIH